MTCEVFDQLFMGGFGQPQIGCFSLTLGEVVTQMREKIQKDITKAKKLEAMIAKIEKQMTGVDLENRTRARALAA